eukprot:1124845-Amphidinium_carterae.1
MLSHQPEKPFTREGYTMLCITVRCAKYAIDLLSQALCNLILAVMSARFFDGLNYLTYFVKQFWFIQDRGHVFNEELYVRIGFRLGPLGAHLYAVAFRPSFFMRYIFESFARKSPGRCGGGAS